MTAWVRITPLPNRLCPSACPCSRDTTTSPSPNLSGVPCSVSPILVHVPGRGLIACSVGALPYPLHGRHKSLMGFEPLVSLSVTVVTTVICVGLLTGCLRSSPVGGHLDGAKATDCG